VIRLTKTEITLRN